MTRDDKIMKGSLEDLALVDILQVLSSQRKTGTLILSGREGEGMVAVKEGKIVYAISPGKKSSLSDLLLSKGVVSANVMEKALETQRSGEFTQRLSTILVSMKAISESELKEFIAWQIEQAVYDLFGWKRGSFHFEIDRVQFDHRVAVDPDNLALDYGLSPQYLMLEASSDIAKGEKGREYRAKRSADLAQEVARSERERQREMVTTQKLPAKESPPSEHHEPEDVFEEVDTIFNQLTDADKQNAVAEQDLPEEGLVLVVDDEAFYRRLIVDVLQTKGYTVLGCGDVSEALHELDNYAWQSTIIAAIVDVIMPEVDGNGILGGFELLNKIVLAYPDLQVLMISASSDPELHYKAYELGARNYLSKPSASGKSFKDSKRIMARFADELSFCLMQIFKERDLLVPRPVTDLSTAVDQEAVPLSLDDINELQRIINSHESVQETLLFLLQTAHHHFDKGMLYLVRKHDIIALTGFDNTRPDDRSEDFYQQVRFSRQADILYNRLISRAYPYLGPLTEHDGAALIESEFAGFSEGEHYIAPLICEGEAFALIDVCNSDTSRPIKHRDKFEFILMHICLSIQKALLQLKLQRRQG